MKKGIIFSLFLSVLLIACSAEEQKETGVIEEREVVEENHIPTTEEEWFATLENSDWYKDVQESGEVLFEQFLDFDGDGIQEIIIGTNSMENKEAILYVGEYSVGVEKWSDLHKESHDYIILKEPRLYGVLENGNGMQVAAISIFEAGASASSEEFRILKTRDSDAQRQIINGFIHSVITDNPATYEVDKENQKITIHNEYSSEIYSLIDNFLTTEDGFKKRLYTGAPITSKEEFIKLLDNSYFETGTYFGDSYHTAISNDSNVVTESEVDGGKVIVFQDYAIYHGYFDPIIEVISFHNFDNLLVSDIEKVIGQQVEIETYYNELEGRYVNTFEFMFDGYRYMAEVSSASDDATVSTLTIYNDL